MNKKDKSATIAFIGDIALLSSAPVPNVSDIKNIFKDSDYVFANLECTLKGHGRPNPPEKDAVLLSTEEYLRILREININVVNLGNNHAFDFGLEGFEETIKFLKKECILYLGAGRNSIEARKTLKIVTKGTCIAFLSYVTYDTHPQISNEKRFGVNMFNLNKAIEDISMSHNNGDFVIVSLHWGAERYNYPTPGQLKAARTMIDAGANLIIGHHSHVLQGMECYKGKYIFYNLGNFYFPDIYNKDKLIVKQKAENFESVILKFKLSQKRIEGFEIFPTTYSVNGEILLAHKENLKKFHKYSRLFNSKYYFLFWKIYRTYIELYKYNWAFLLIKGETYFHKDMTFWGYLKRIRLKHFKALINDILKLRENKCDM